VVPSGVATPGTLAETRVPHTLRRFFDWRTALPWAVAVVALAGAGAAWGAAIRNRSSSSTLRFEIRIPSNATIATGLGNPVAVAPGGRHIAYAANAADGSRKLFVRSAEDLQAREIPGSEFARFPFFSPDGKWVSFWASGQLKKAAVDGGSAVLLTDLPVISRVSWSPSGRLVMSVNGKLATTSAAGGAPTTITTPDSAHGETAQVQPVALADGKTALYTSLAMGGAAAARIGVASLEDGTTTILDVQGSYSLGVLDGYLIYITAGGAVMAVRFDARKRRVSGVPVPVIDQIATETGNPNSYADLSADGTLVYLSGLSQRQLMEVGANGALRPIIPDAGGYGWPRLSPDGRRLAVTVSSPSRSDIWIYDLPSGPLTRLTTEGTTNDRPEWMPDGKSVMFRSNRGGLNALWLQPVDGAGAATLLFGLKEAKVDEGALSSDGRYLLFQRDRTGRGELWYKTLQGDTVSRQVGTGPHGEVGGRFSPDGKWVVYASSEFGTSQVYVRPFPSLAARYQVSLNGGATPLWSPDGKRIFYMADRQIIAATIGSTQPFSIASRVPVFGRGFSFNGIHADYDVARDGRTFLALRPADDDAQLIAVHNWRAELRARMQGNAR
jgi:serine/threonine-protein kinase